MDTHYKSKSLAYTAPVGIIALTGIEGLTLLEEQTARLIPESLTDGWHRLHCFFVLRAGFSCARYRKKKKQENLIFIGVIFFFEKVTQRKKLLLCRFAWYGMIKENDFIL